ncbi:mucin-2 [Drosophila mojavensis]|uniref:Uncharacterized protein n=1 Tax=Drosophila mojavensis TaxID=7230 RepID=A0A0Q9XCD0_DROMO|nr:mucin-2 [Drosophila mojavensis]KRG02354.1 uncharacterized protein Dmoj_GI26556 [Drosophila mojavensis]
MQPAIFYTIVLLGLGSGATEARPFNSTTEDHSITSGAKTKSKIGVHMDISEDMAVDKERTVEPLMPKSATISPSLKVRAQQENDRNTAVDKETTTTTSPVKAKSSTIVPTPTITIQQRIDADAATVRNTLMEPIEAKSSMTNPSPKISAATVLNNGKSSQSKTAVETFKSSSASTTTTDVTPLGIEPRLSVTLLKILARYG